MDNDQLHQIDTMEDQGNNNDQEESEEESNESAIQPESLRKSLGDLIVLWEQRLSENRRQRNKDNASTTTADDDVCHTTDDIDAPPAVVYATTTWWENETTGTSTDGATPNLSSPRRNIGLMKHLSHTFGVSPGRNIIEYTAELDALENIVEERDLKIESLQTVISSDTEIIGKMIDTMKKMVGQKEAGSVMLSQDKKNDTVEDDFERLQRMITDLKGQSSSQENVIELLRAEMVNLLVAKRMVEENLMVEVEQRDVALSNLKTLCEERADQSSFLEDEIEKLRAENVRLRVRSQMLEEEKVELETKTYLRYDIL